MTKPRRIGDHLVYRLRLTRVGETGVVCIPRDVIRTFGWHYGHTMELALVESSDAVTRAKFSGIVITRSNSDSESAERAGDIDVSEVERVIGQRSRKRRPSSPTTTTTTTTPASRSPRMHVPYASIRYGRLRVSTTACMVTIPRDFMFMLRWRAPDDVRNPLGDTMPITLAMVVLDDGVVISRIDE
jgi:hypothetical protein